MFAMLHYNGDAPESMLEEDGHLTVAFDWEKDRKQYRCWNCDTVFTDEEDAEDEECADTECSTGHDCDEVEPTEEPCVFTHHLVEETEPLSWVNSVGIHFNEEADQIDLSISLGDPRGAFVMRVYRTDKGLRMGVPHPNDSVLHLPLREINDGFYAVNEEGK